MTKNEIAYLTPRMSIDYRKEASVISGGTQDVREGLEMPAHFYGAEITQYFPVLSNEGKLRLALSSFNVVMGTAVSVAEVLENFDEYCISFYKLDELKKGICTKRIVVVPTQFSNDPRGKKNIVYLNSDDLLCETQEQLECIIKTIASRYIQLNMSINIVPQNVNSGESKTLI